MKDSFCSQAGFTVNLCQDSGYIVYSLLDVSHSIKFVFTSTSTRVDSRFLSGVLTMEMPP